MVRTEISLFLKNAQSNTFSNKLFSTELFWRGHACTAKLAPHPHMTLAQRNMLVFFAGWAGRKDRTRTY